MSASPRAVPRRLVSAGTAVRGLTAAIALVAPADGVYRLSRRHTLALEFAGGTITASIDGTPGEGGGDGGVLRGQASGRCVDVPNRSRANGTRIILWTCNGGGNQRWTRT